MPQALPSRQHSMANVPRWKAAVPGRIPFIPNMPANLVLRGSELIWYLRFAQLACAGFVLAVTSMNASDWRSATCNIPKALGVNLFAAAISIPCILYFMASTGPFQIKTLPWSQYAQLIVEAGLFVMWMIATPASDYNCATVCGACTSTAAMQSQNPSSFYMWVGGLTCSCQLQQVKGMQILKQMFRRVHRQARERPGKGLDTTKIISTVARMAQKKHFSYAMTALFALSFLLTCLSVWRQRQLVKRRGQGHAHHLPKEYRDLEKSEKASFSTCGTPVSRTPVSPLSPPRSP